MERGDAKRKDDWLSKHVLRALSILQPGWKIMPLSAIHWHTRHNLERRGWAEFKIVPKEYMVARITKAGREVRDELDKRSAMRVDAAMGWHRKSWREFRKDSKR